MQRFRNILAGVDLSEVDRLAADALTPPDQEAVRRAIWLAGQLSSQLTFFSALEIPPTAGEFPDADIQQATTGLREAAQKTLDELVERARQEGVEAKTELAIGQDWVEIIRQVQRAGHDLVIVGTRERGGVSRMLFGSTGMKLLRKCPSPVWIVRPDPNWDDVVMLVATDLGEVGQQALEIAINGAQMFDAKVHVVHALDLHFERQMLLGGYPREKMDAIREKRLAAAEETLQKQLAQTDYRTLTFGVNTHVIEGPPDMVILQAIEDLGIDLLVMGTVARTGIPGVLIGNTAERVLPDVPCSVLAIKPPDFQCPISLD